MKRVSTSKVYLPYIIALEPKNCERNYLCFFELRGGNSPQNFWLVIHYPTKVKTYKHVLRFETLEEAKVIRKLLKKSYNQPIKTKFIIIKLHKRSSQE